MSVRQPGVDVARLDEWIDGTSQEVRIGRANIFYKSGEDHPLLPANEFIASRLATALGLPVPAGDVGRDERETLGWVTLEVPNALNYSPPNPQEVVAREPELSAGCIVFDVWVGNHDRHEKNIIYHRNIGFWLIDHELALGGAAEDLGTLSSQASLPGRLHFFATARPSEPQIEAWVQRVRKLPVSVVDGTLREARARRLVTTAQRDAIRGYVILRQKHLAGLVAQTLGWQDRSMREEEGLVL